MGLDGFRSRALIPSTCRIPCVALTPLFMLLFEFRKAMAQSLAGLRLWMRGDAVLGVCVSLWEVAYQDMVLGRDWVRWVFSVWMASVF